MDKKTVRLLVCGCCGKMGRLLVDTVANERSSVLEVVAGVDASGGYASFPVYKSIDNVTCPVDVLVDFSSPSLLDGILRYAEKYHVAAVIATTGHTAAQRKRIAEVSRDIPIFFSANMSFGVNVVNALVAQAVQSLGDGYDIEIIDAHHNAKADSPSGTALMLADTAARVRGGAEYVYDRSKRGKRRHREIGIHSVRAGTIVGSHEVIIAGDGEEIRITHISSSRRIFVLGAIRAASFISARSSGLYDMNDMIRKEQKNDPGYQGSYNGSSGTS